MNKSQLLLGVVLVACTVTEREMNNIDIQGHRGARGLAPENSVPAFLMATRMGVTTLELDLVVSKDGRLVVSHEPYFSSVFCLDPKGSTIPSDSVINIYQMTYEEIEQYDCGSKGNPNFPDQQLLTAPKPLLENVIEAVESEVETLGRASIYYNIELKTTKETDTTFHPVPAEFSDLVYEALSKKGILGRVTIQSFDFRTLQYFHKKYPEVRLALLIENELSWEENIDSLGFTPHIYSCYYPLLSKEIVSAIKAAGMKVIPWTINDVAEMEKQLEWEVDGIITDYPDRALTLTNK